MKNYIQLLFTFLATFLLLASENGMSQTLTDTWTATPSWNKASEYRGFAYGNNRLYVGGRPDGIASVEVVNALSGADIKSLSTTGVLDLTFDLCDAEFSDDGSVLAAPVTLNASAETGWGAGHFTIYRWTDEMSDPEPFIVYTGDGRVDMFTVVGDITADAVVMGAVSSTRRVWRYIITDGVIGDVEEITVAETIPTGTVAVAFPTGLTAADGFWYNNLSIHPTLCDNTGAVVGVVPGVVFQGAQGNTGQMKAFTYDSKDFLLVADNGKARLINITGKQPSALTVNDVVHTTQGAFNLNQDVTYRISPDGALSIYSFSANNGIYSASTEAAPVATELEISGLAKLGETLTASYVYADINNDPEGASEIKWYLADDADGTNKTEITSAAGSTTYTIVAENENKYISFSVLPVAQTGTASFAEYLVESPLMGPILTDAEAPVASNVTITGPIAVNETLTGTYTYFDENGDLEGATEIKWYTADDAAGTNQAEVATGALTYLVKPADEGKYILFSVTPVAQTGGLLIGENVTVASDSAVFFPDFPPVASNLAITGREEVDGILTGTYTYSDLNGDEEGATVIKWYRADDATGTNMTEVASGEMTYTVVAADETKYIIFEVTPVTVDGETGDPAMVATAVIAAKPTPEAPVASDVMVHGTPEVGIVIYGSYTYSDRTDDPEGVSIHKWYTADDAAGANKVEITGAAGSYVLAVTESMIGKHLVYEITPVATIGELLTGDPVAVVTAEAAVASTNDGDFERVWMRAAKANAVPEYIGTGGTERGFAVGADHIYIASRFGGTKLLVVDKENGALISEMNTDGMDVGLFKISDVEVSDDGQILACPLQLNSSVEPFVVYKWENELAAPTRFIEFTSVDALRLGDKFTVVGDVSGNAVIYAVQSAGNKVVRWVVTGGIVDEGTIITLQNVTSVGSTPSAYPFSNNPEANFIVDGRGAQAQIFDKDGNYVGALEGIGQSNNQSNSPEIFYYKGRTLVAFHQKNDAGEWDIIVQDITGSSHITVGTSEILSTANQELGGVHVEADDDNFHLYMLSANNGIARFRGILELPEFEYAETDEAGEKVHVWFSKNMSDEGFEGTGWSINAGGAVKTVDTIYRHADNPMVLTLELTDGVLEGNTVKLEYDGTGNIVSFDGMPLNAFGLVDVVNVVGAAAPEALDVNIAGAERAGETFTASYTYSDANGDLEGDSDYQWWYAGNAEGSDKLKILGESGLEYTVGNDMQGKYIAFEVIPVALTGGLNYLVGEPAVSDFVRVIPVGVDNAGIESIRVYPNPVVDLLTIENGSAVKSVSLIDVTGKLIHSENRMNESRITLNMSGYSSGLYYLKLQDEAGVSSIIKIVKVQ
jgi:hypothetical protein